MTAASDPVTDGADLLSRAGHLANLFPPLLIESERVASIVQQGLHGRRRSGIGESFWQFRRYISGDPAGRIDWRQSARTDKLFIREREWEAAQSVYLWADPSGSMRYRSRKTIATKVDRANLLMLALADLLIRGGEKAVWLAKEPRVLRDKQALQSLAAHPHFGQEGTSLPPQIRLPRHAHVILCSDFLMPSDELAKQLQNYAALNLRGVLLQIIDPVEDTFTFEGRLELLGCEGEEPLLLANASALHAAYHERAIEHKLRLARLAENAGWYYTRHITDTAPHHALMQVVQSLAADRRGM